MEALVFSTHIFGEVKFKETYPSSFFKLQSINVSLEVDFCFDILGVFTIC